MLIQLPGADQPQAQVERGDLVPDDLVITITKARVVKANTEGGYILDGYPRTLAQAEAAHRRATACRSTWRCGSRSARRNCWPGWSAEPGSRARPRSAPR
jgi:Adenylate kinase